MFTYLLYEMSSFFFSSSFFLLFLGGGGDRGVGGRDRGVETASPKESEPAQQTLWEGEELMSSSCYPRSTYSARAQLISFVPS